MKGEYVSGGAVGCGLLFIFLFYDAVSYSPPLPLATPFLFMASILFLVGVPGGIYLVVTQRRHDEEPLEEGPSTGIIQEKIITERVLVVCPFCSTKVEQGTSFCTNCGGKM